MTKFTKGPWVAKRGNNFWGFECKDHGKLGNVASSAFSGFQKLHNAEEVMKAKAHLIAAAPELYEALSEMVEQAIGCWHNHYGHEQDPNDMPMPEHIGKARAALAKARGEA